MITQPTGKLFFNLEINSMLVMPDLMCHVVMFFRSPILLTSLISELQFILKYLWGFLLFLISLGLQKKSSLDLLSRIIQCLFNMWLDWLNSNLSQFLWLLIYAYFLYFCILSFTFFPVWYIYGALPHIVAIISLYLVSVHLILVSCL